MIAEFLWELEELADPFLLDETDEDLLLGRITEEDYYDLD